MLQDVTFLIPDECEEHQVEPVKPENPLIAELRERYASVQVTSLGEIDRLHVKACDDIERYCWRGGYTSTPREVYEAYLYIEKLWAEMEDRLQSEYEKNKTRCWSSGI